MTTQTYIGYMYRPVDITSITMMTIT